MKDEQIIVATKNKRPIAKIDSNNITRLIFNNIAMELLKPVADYYSIRIDKKFQGVIYLVPKTKEEVDADPSLKNTVVRFHGKDAKIKPRLLYVSSILSSIKDFDASRSFGFLVTKIIKNDIECFALTDFRYL